MLEDVPAGTSPHLVGGTQPRRRRHAKISRYSLHVLRTCKETLQVDGQDAARTALSGGRNAPMIRRCSADPAQPHVARRDRQALPYGARRSRGNVSRPLGVLQPRSGTRAADGVGRNDVVTAPPALYREQMISGRRRGIATVIVFALAVALCGCSAHRSAGTAAPTRRHRTATSPASTRARLRGRPIPPLPAARLPRPAPASLPRRARRASCRRR